MPSLDGFSYPKFFIVSTSAPFNRGEALAMRDAMGIAVASYVINVIIAVFIIIRAFFVPTFHISLVRAGYWL